MSQYFSGLTDSCRRASAYICMPAGVKPPFAKKKKKKKVKLALNVKRCRTCGDANELLCLGSPELMTNCNKVRCVRRTRARLRRRSCFSQAAFQLRALAGFRSSSWSLLMLDRRKERYDSQRLLHQCRGVCVDDAWDCDVSRLQRN